MWNSEDNIPKDAVLSASTRSASTWAVSVCFWSALAVAAVCYGAVALAPKFSMWSDARGEYRNNSLQLASLEKKIDYLERVKLTLETDTDFVRRLSESSRPDEVGNEDSDRIPVSGDLLFGETDDESNPVVAVDSPRIRSGFVYSLASNTRIRAALLTFSACLTVFAFTFLNDAGASLVYLTGRLIKATAMLPVARYVPKSDSTEDVD